MRQELEESGKEESALMSAMAKWAVWGGAIVAAWAWAEPAAAQYFAPRSANVGRATADYLLDRPTVSPYLNLLRLESSSAMPNYHTLVRPEVENRQEAARQAMAIRQLQNNVSSMQGEMNGSQGFSTGHPTRFMTYLHYYPGLLNVRRR
jgi:hypothetical protein